VQKTVLARICRCYDTLSKSTARRIRLNDSSYRDLAGIAEIPDGSSMSFQESGHDILICHTQNEFFAVENKCSHAMAKLAGGRLRAYRLICPLHGASFDVRDGSVLAKPATLPIRVYPLRVIGDRIQVCLEPQ
jgi:3-phenylpropionate/trans-cinnamate dioxygenase ferredoxin subunit